MSRKYDREFKIEAVRMACEEGVSAGEEAQERDILKNIVGTLATTCGNRNSERWVSSSVPGRRDRPLTGDTIPVKKRGPGILADLRLATPLGDPV